MTIHILEEVTSAVQLGVQPKVEVLTIRNNVNLKAEERSPSSVNTSASRSITTRRQKRAKQETKLSVQTTMHSQKSSRTTRNTKTEL